MGDGNPQADDKFLAGRVALVTGGSRGIGLAIARRLGGLGAHVGICGRNADRLKQASQQLDGEGIAVLAVVADVTRAADVAALVQKVEAELGPLDILVNNAGMGIFGLFHERSEAEWDTLIDTNLKSVFLVSRAVVPGNDRATARQHHQHQLAGWEKMRFLMAGFTARPSGA